MKKTFRMIDLDCANCAAKMGRDQRHRQLYDPEAHPGGR